MICGLFPQASVRKSPLLLRRIPAFRSCDRNLFFGARNLRNPLTIALHIEHPHRPPIRRRLQQFEPHARVVLPHHRILRCRNVFAEDPPHPPSLRLPHQQVHHRLFHLPPQHPATHQPRIDHQVVSGCPQHSASPRRPGDDYPNHPVVAVDIPQPELHRHRGTILHQPHHLRLRPAPRRQIELIRLVDELHNPPASRRIESAPPQLHPQPRQIPSQVRPRTCATLSRGSRSLPLRVRR